MSRSLGAKHEILDFNQNKQPQLGISRSCTFERLPKNEEKAQTQGESNNNNLLNYQIDSKGSRRNDSLNGNFTFTTFVKQTNNGNNTESFDSVSSTASLTSQHNISNNNKVQSNNSQNLKKDDSFNNSRMEDTSGFSSTTSGSSAQTRKTCLVTTV